MDRGAVIVDTVAAAGLLRRGAVLAYPTEAVWGLGCDPFDEAAVQRLLTLKRRPVDKGLIVAAADAGQLAGLVDWTTLSEDRRAAVLASWPGPHTWILPAGTAAPRWITGDHDGVAVRVSAHPRLAALCAACGPLVSTSANLAGAPPPRRRDDIAAAILAGVDGVVDGDTGDLAAPTPIRDARSGRVLRV